MRKATIESLRAIGIALLMAILTINLASASLGFIVKSTILQPSFLAETLAKEEGYGQIRQLMLRMVNRSLPNGGDSIPYLEKVLSESWLREEIDDLLENFYRFARGKRDDPPAIPLYKLKKQIADTLEDNRSYKDRVRLVQFWFDPLPDEVRLGDFISIGFIWGLRYTINFMFWFPWILCGIGLFIIFLMYLIIFDWKETVLWTGSAIIASGFLLVVLGLTADWLIGRMSIVSKIVDGLVFYEIPEASVNNLLKFSIKGITRPMNAIGVLSIFVGGAIVHLIPVDERMLTLIK